MSDQPPRGKAPYGDQRAENNSNDRDLRGAEAFIGDRMLSQWGARHRIVALAVNALGAIVLLTILTPLSGAGGGDGAVVSGRW